MNVRIKYSMNFVAGIYYDGEMRMNNYGLTVSMITNTSDSVSHNIAFERIKYFVYNKINSSIFINQDHGEQCEKFISAGLSITTMPGEPVDQLIGLMLYCKLNAIMEDRIVVEETEINSMLGENIVYLHSENENTDIDNIPNWWNTADCVHSDYVLLHTEKIVPMHSNTEWRELDLTWPESDMILSNGNVVVFDNFKPNNDTK